MRKYILAGATVGLLNACATVPEVSSYTVGEVSEWKHEVNESPSYPSSLSTTSFKLRLKYSSPLKAPFKVYSDLRCLRDDGTLNVWQDKGIGVGFNVPPDSYFEPELYWTDFDPSRYKVCQIRLFDYDETRGKLPSDRVKYFGRYCFTAENEARVISFNPSPAEKCSFDK